MNVYVSHDDDDDSYDDGGDPYYSLMKVCQDADHHCRYCSTMNADVASFWLIEIKFNLIFLQIFDTLE